MWDVLVAGGGHNGLTAAAYLARAGLRTLVLERRPLVGGACVTEELWPGFRVSRGAYVAGLLRPAVVRELDLRRHGLRLLRRDPSSYTPLEDGRGLFLGPDAEATAASIRRFSERDAAHYPAYERLLDRAARCVEPLLDAPPADPAHPHWRDLGPLLRAGRRALALGRDLPRALSVVLAPAGETLCRAFESEPLRGTLATDALIGACAAPSTPGTGYVLFHHVMGETGGARGVWAYVQGGMGRLAVALAAAARAAGAEIRTDAEVAGVLQRDGRAAGVVLADGSELASRCVVSGADPHRTLLGWVGAAALPPDDVAALEALDFSSPAAKLNVALDRLPCFRGRPAPGAGGAGPEHRGTIHVGAQTLAELEASHAAGAAGRLPERPMIELTLPSALDPSLAPPGRHVASLFVQHVPYRLDEPGGWESGRRRLAERVFGCVDAVAPGFAASVREWEVLAPPDLEQLFGLRGGNIFHGAMSLHRLGFLRPVAGWAAYRTPLPGLYLCGAGTHPGGGVMGACGRNAAGIVLADWRRQAGRMTRSQA